MFSDGLFGAGWAQTTAALVAFVLAGALVSLGLRQYRWLRLADRDSRLGHAFWLLLEFGFASWLVSIAFWTLDDRQPHFPPLARPFVALAVAAFLAAFVIRFTSGGRAIGRWLASLPPPRS
jgi:hypothetical protein